MHSSASLVHFRGTDSRSSSAPDTESSIGKHGQTKQHFKKANQQTPKITTFLKYLGISKPLVIISYPAAEKTSTSDVKGKQNLSTHRLKPVVYLSKE